jgi:Fuc2NAc and GlcNAc transferase
VAATGITRCRIDTNGKVVFDFRGSTRVMAETYWVAGGAFVLAALLTGAVRSVAIRGGVFDIPNERSSHTRPTPRGGGAAIVIAVIASAFLLSHLQIISPRLLWALVGGGIAVAAVGAIDDRFTVPAWVKLAVHVAAALWALQWLGGLSALRLGDRLIELHRAGYVLGTIVIVWILNLFNFMDGIDGIAASQAVFVCCAGAAIAAILGLSSGVIALSLVIGGACSGFLLWNWPPARIFMGDVGSGFVGFALAVIAISAAHEQASALWIWIILGGVFVVDATLTLLRRIARGEMILSAHRSHAYQWLSRRWRSHKRVTIAVALVNVLWLLPSALLAAFYRDRASWIAASALLPIVGLAIAAGAGRSEHTVTLGRRE